MAGVPGAFDRFVDHFSAKIFNYSWLMCGQREDAEEVAQDTLLKVFENFSQLREPDRVRPWVFRIAKTACLTKRRKSIFAPSASQEISLDDRHRARTEIADRSRLPEEQALRAEQKRELEAAIRALPQIYRCVILLRDMEELSTQDTAQVLDVTEDVVKTRLHRARAAIRKYLEERRSAGLSRGEEPCERPYPPGDDARERLRQAYRAGIGKASPQS